MFNKIIIVVILSIKLSLQSYETYGYKKSKGIVFHKTIFAFLSNYQQIIN